MTRWGSIRESRPIPNGAYTAPALGILILVAAILLAVIA